jgi:hypothetical protein
MNSDRSPRERQVADILRRARRLPVGPHRNDLRQLAVGLLWLHRRGMDTSLELHTAPAPVADQVLSVKPGEPVEQRSAG